MSQLDEGGTASGQAVPTDLYFFGIIDILQSYNTKKTLETALKGVLYETDTISAVPPDQYVPSFSLWIFVCAYLFDSHV